MKEILTHGAKEDPPYGSFDDYVILESPSAQERLLMRPEEFEYLSQKLFDNWSKRKSLYIQMLKEWNEGIGFDDIDEKPSLLKDIPDTIFALQLIKAEDNLSYVHLTQQDLKLILDFFVRHENNQIFIRKE